MKKNNINLIKIKKVEFNKYLKFSNCLLIEKDKMNFIKLDSSDNIINKDIDLLNSLDRPFFIFFTKEIRKAINQEGYVLQISVEDKYLKLNNLKIEMINTVVKYV